jgi:thiamine biosynthesis lipoprotein
MVALESPAPGGQILAPVPQLFEHWEQSLSRFRTDSELNRLNHSAGTWQAVSPTLNAVLELAVQAAKISAGTITPLTGQALAQIGYADSFVPNRSQPAPRTPYQASPLPDVDSSLKLAEQQVWLAPQAMLDLGGIAKGWAAAQIVQQLAPFGAVLCDAGGDIAVSAPQAPDTPWIIGIQAPDDSETLLDWLPLWHGAVATSGRDYRRWQQAGQWQHHIIDPRTGQPALTDVLSASVTASDAWLAETAAKTILILGSTAGLAWFTQQFPNESALIVLENHQIIRHGAAWEH